MTLWEILRRLGELAANWEAVRALLDAISLFVRGETVPIVITWERKRLVITVQLQETAGQGPAAQAYAGPARRMSI